MAEENKKDDENLENTDNSGETSETEGKKRFNKKTIIKILLIIFLSGASLAGGLIASVGIGGIGEIFSSSDSKLNSDTEEGDHTTDKEADSGDSHDTGEGDTQEHTNVEKIFNLNEIIVNISGTTAGGRKTSRFMKINLAITYNSDKEDTINSRRAFIRDSFQDYLRQLDEKDLIGTAGLLNLRAELIKRAKVIVGEDGPIEVLISDLIIQ